MKLKSLMLGAAAAAAATTAQAADLPVAPEPIDYVRVCDAYGSRFYYIPGTETCLRVGGRVRVEYKTTNFADNGSWGDRTANDITFRARGYVYLDSRTNTEFGLLRTYTSMYMTGDTGPSESFFLEAAYIQWGGITAGRTTSFFQFATGQAFIGVITRDWADTTTNLLAYTAAFGNGFSATVALEDSTFTESSAAIYAGQRWPDLVANLRVDQGWGSAQLSGAVYDVRPISASKSGSFGWAIGAGVVFNLPMLSSDSNIFFQAQYADGKLDYIGNAAGVADYDFVIGSGSSDTSSGYSLSAGIYHQATETIGLALDGSWSDIDGGGTINGATRWAIDGSVQYSPVSGFAVGVDMGYADTDYDGTATDVEDWRAGIRLQRTF